MDRTGPAGTKPGERSDSHLRDVGPLCVLAACGALLKLGLAVCDHPDRADVDPVSAAWRPVAGNGQ